LDARTEFKILERSLKGGVEAGRAQDCSPRVPAPGEPARLIEGENALSQKLVIEKKSWIPLGNCHGAVDKWVYARSQFSSSRHAIWFLDEHLKVFGVQLTNLLI